MSDVKVKTGETSTSKQQETRVKQCKHRLWELPPLPTSEQVDAAIHAGQPIPRPSSTPLTGHFVPDAKTQPSMPAARIEQRGRQLWIRLDDLQAPPYWAEVTLSKDDIMSICATQSMSFDAKGRHAGATAAMKATVDAEKQTITFTDQTPSYSWFRIAVPVPADACLWS